MAGALRGLQSRRPRDSRGAGVDSQAFPPLKKPSRNIREGFLYPSIILIAGNDLEDRSTCSTYFVPLNILI